MSDSGVSIETIADLCGRAGTAVTEEVYRRQLKPMMTKGAETIKAVFKLWRWRVGTHWDQMAVGRR
jgi:hypothetical protein